MKILNFFNFFKNKTEITKKQNFPFEDKDSKREIINYPSGKINCETEIFDNKRNGFSIGFFENGKKQFEGYYRNDLKFGLWKFYFQNGKLQSETTYKDGYLDGNFKYMTKTTTD